MSVDRERAVVCLSGGMDSCVSLAEAMHQRLDVAALHFSYGQRTSERERRAFENLCDHYAITTRMLAEQPALGRMGASALTDRALEVPRSLPGAGVPITYVPFRNGQILALACAWAESLRAHSVWIGAVEEDSSGYPDCRGEFFEAFERAVAAGTRPDSRIKIVTPVLHCSKAEIVQRATKLGAPLDLTWSCYTDGEIACGECESCRLRLRGFAGAGIPDPLPYRSSDVDGSTSRSD